MTEGWDSAALTDYLTRRLAQPWDVPAAGPLKGDGDLVPGGEPASQRRLARRSAAVLVPLITRSQGVTVLLTRRTRAMRRHSGQVAFPGGRVDPEDPDVVAAALREAEEEVGLDRAKPAVLGCLTPYDTATGFSVTPVVATVAEPFEAVPDPGEVETVFEVPLTYLMDTRNHQRHTGMWKGLERGYYAIAYGDNTVWGATAAMLVNLVHVLSPADETPAPSNRPPNHHEPA